MMGNIDVITFHMLTANGFLLQPIIVVILISWVYIKGRLRKFTSGTRQFYTSSTLYEGRNKY